MIIASVLLLSIIIQLISAYLALRLIRITRNRLAWVLIAAAISLMAIRRIITFFRLISGDMAKPPDLMAEIVALVISLLMVSGISAIKPVFLSISQTEESLQYSESYLSKVERIASIGNWDWHIEDNYLHWSDEIFRIFGLTPGEFDATYEAFLKTVHPDDREDVQAAVDAALNENHEYDIEHRIVLPTGEERIVHESAEITLDEAGKPIRMFGVVQDITDRKRSEEARNIFEKRLLNIQNISADAIITVNEEHIITHINIGAVKIFGYQKSELIGQPLQILLPSHLAEKHQAHIHNFVASQDISRPMGTQQNVVGKRKDGSLFPAESSISKLIEGDSVTLTAVVRDITRRKQFADQIHEQMKNLSALREIDMAITASLDLRVTLNVILDQVTSRLNVDAADIFYVSQYFFFRPGFAVWPV